MKSTIQALQDLYVKLGGSLTDTYDTIANGEAVGNYTTIPDMIEACTQKAGSGGGSSLPAVTAEDNDSVLTVVNGAWDKAAAPTGAVAVIYFTLEGTTATSDLTAGEVKTLIEAGKVVIARLNNDGKVSQLMVGDLTFNDGSGDYNFYAYTADDRGGLNSFLAVANDLDSPYEVELS